MTAWKKRLIALALWVPFALYAAHVVSRAIDHSVTPFPTSPLPEREKAAKAKAEVKAKADAARAELKAAAAFDPEEIGPHKAVLAERNWAAKNALQVNDPKPDFKFGGDRKKRFEELAVSQGDLTEKRGKISAWHMREVPPDASAHLKDFRDTLLKELRDAEAAESEVIGMDLRATYKCAMASVRPLAETYEREVGKKVLPLVGSKHLMEDAKALLQMHREYRTRTDASPAAQNDLALKGLLERMFGDEADWTARLELLDLFAEEPTEKSPENAKAWFEKVNALYGKLKDEKTKTLIRSKVQHFCNAYVPEKLALDGEVIKGKDRVERSAIKVRYRYKVGKPFRDTDALLTADPGGLNEFTARDKAQTPKDAEFDAFTHNESPVDVEPTPQSKAAFEYFKHRQNLTTDTWTATTVASIIGKAGPDGGDLWNQLSRIGKTAGAYNVYNRLKIVQESIEKYRKNLFP